MVLKAFDEAEIDMIYKKKVYYSILKYDMELEKFKELNSIDVFNSVMKKKYKATKDKYNVALNYNSGDVSYKEFDDIVSLLDIEEQKYLDVKRENQMVLDTCVHEIIKILESEISKLDNDIDKCRFLFEYVCKTIKHNELSKMYNYDIPYGGNYYFEFSDKGVPVGDKVSDLLVLKSGSPNDITGLLEYLGRRFSLPIKAVTCEYNRKPYILNAYEMIIPNDSKEFDNIDDYDDDYDEDDEDDDIIINQNESEKDDNKNKVKVIHSYIDPNAVIGNRKTIEDAFLVDRPTLNIGNNKKVYTKIKTGINLAVNYDKQFDFTDIIEKEKALMPGVEYISNNVFGEKKK